MFLLYVCLPRAAAYAEGFGTQLLLEIWINGHTRHQIATVTDLHGILFMDDKDLADLHIKINPAEIPPGGQVAINRLSGVDAKILDTEQELQITAVNDRVMPQAFDLHTAPDSAAATSATGFIGSYNLVGTVDNFEHTRNTTNCGATIGGTYFTPQGTLSANGFSQSQNGLAHFIRLDTAAEVDETDKMRRWVVGDAVSGGLNWSRSVRFAGLQMATDFSLRPDLATMPLPAFFGQTAVPATVDVFVNSARVFETNVDSGPFQINNLPVITGTGQVNIVTRDVLGQETAASLPFYASSQLLQNGLDAYDVDAGMVRRNYGLSSMSYDTPMASGTYRIGMSDSITLEAHSEAAREVQLAGGGIIFGLDNYGLMHLATAASTYGHDGQRQNGGLGSVSIESQAQPAGFFASASKTLGHYADVATIGGSAPPTFQTQIGGDVGFGKKGTLALSWIEAKNDGQPMNKLASGSYTVTIFNRLNIGLTSFYDVTNHATISEAVLSMSFGGGLIGHTSLRADKQAHQEELGVIKPVTNDGGVGYQLSATTGETNLKQGEVTWINSRGSLDGSFASRNGVNAGRITATGGIVAMDGSVYATQYPNGAVALISTGQPNARIMQENREVARTDNDGEALLTNFVPFTSNRIAIDPRDFDLSTIIDKTEATVVPRRQSGVLVDLTPTVHHPALIVLHLDNGDYLPLGTPLALSNDPHPGVVGRHGESYIADLSKPITGIANYGKGTCHFEVSSPPPTKDTPIPRIDPVICISDQPTAPTNGAAP